VLLDLGADVGPRQVQGLVVSLADATPVPETRPVSKLLFQEPVFQLFGEEFYSGLPEQSQVE